MYRQVWNEGKDMNFQRIIWRRESDQPLNLYALIKTVTYGTAPASFLAIRSLLEIANINSKRYPQASYLIKNDFYVDDLITGVESLEEGIRIKNELNTLLKSAGFILRKWRSNCSELLEDKCESVFEVTGASEGKILRLTWISTADTLSYDTEEIPNQNISKRTILSAISKLFDPLGLLAPVLIKAKLLIQKLWQIKCNWDSAVPYHLEMTWLLYNSSLKVLNSLKIPRRVTKHKFRDAVIHGFCDASEEAYCACLYLWTIDTEGSSSVHLLCAKSRVAPLKKLSLPRLELCGAQLLAQLHDAVVPTLGVSIYQSYFWTDSIIVLAWLKFELRTWKTFVANRVSEIQQITEVKNWHHVSSDANPADLLSRGVDPNQILSLDIWWHGPKWLQGLPNEWPINQYPEALDTEESVLERRPQITLSAATIPNYDELLLRYSTFEKLQKIVAWSLRFANNSRKSSEERYFNALLTLEELESSAVTICKLVQTISFPEELKQLKAHGHVNSTSKIIRLNPFLGEDDLIRVGGRLRNSSLPFEEKHPVLLPAKNFVTDLIISQAHRKCLHGGNSMHIGQP